ncbi:MAG: [protein-PII] uridylyltransferase [Deltaproteobacteria bacterium]
MRKGELRARRDALDSLWKQGLNGRALLTQHTQLIDAYLTQCFAGCPEAREGVALVALGGYGRGELYPFSDIDLMVLHAPEVQENLDAVSEAVFYPLWDAGLDVGHAVRTPGACLSDAEQDFFLQVALIDARLVTGSIPLFRQLQDAFRVQFVEGRRQHFFEEMNRLRTERHSRYGLHSYLLEPHIKESRGGFRDIQAMLWTAQVVFGLDGLTGLEEAGLLTSREREEIEEAWEGLIRIRNQLHYLSGRKNDQLFFEHQEEMAKVFGYRSSGDFLDVEHFMREVYRYLQTIAVATDLFFEHTGEVLAAGPEETGKKLEPGLALRRGHIHLAHPDLLPGKPQLLMRVFLQAARTGRPVHHRTRKAINSHLHLLTDRLRRSRRLAKNFLEILTCCTDPLPVLTAMLETGLLTAYLPEFRQVESLAQHDVYHVFTVDRHLLQTVAELEQLREEEPLAAEVAAPQILALAALLHDIGKGQGSEHAEKGAALARIIGQRLGLTEAEIDTLVFLIRYHLFLMKTALRRDLEDESFLIRCAREIGDADRLHMLYLLTIADARATGPAAWNDWKAALLLELYLKLAHLLEDSDLKHPDAGQGVEWMREQVRRLLHGDDDRLKELPEDYFLSFSPATVVRHLELRAGLGRRQALIVPTDCGEYWSLLVMARNRTGLLARICGTLALHNLEVVAAQIFTWPDDTAVDVIHVHPSLDNGYRDQDWNKLEKDLNLVLSNRLALAHRLVHKRRLPLLNSRRRHLRSAQPQVVIDNAAVDHYTVVEVHAENRSGLLYDISNTLAELAIDIHRAKIATQAEQSIDAFYVRDAGGRKISDPVLQEEIRQSLLYAAAPVKEKA